MNILPSFLPLTLAGLNSPPSDGEGPSRQRPPPVPLGCVLWGSWAAPPFPNFAFSKQLYIFQGKQEPVGAQPGCGGDGQGSSGCSQCRCWRCCWVSFRAAFSCLERPGAHPGSFGRTWVGLGWAGLPTLVLYLALFHIPKSRRLIADPCPTINPNLLSQCSSLPPGSSYGGETPESRDKALWGHSWFTDQVILPCPWVTHPQVPVGSVTSGCSEHLQR